MFNNDAGDVTGLEVVFQSQQFGRAVGAGVGQQGAAIPAGPEAIIFRREFGSKERRSTPLVSRGRGDEGESVAPRGGAVPPEEGAVLTAEPQLAPTSRVRGAAAGLARTTPPSATLPRAQNHGFRSVALVSGAAAVALVVAGVTAGTGPHRSPAVSAQAKQATAGPRGGSHPTSGGGSAGTAETGGRPLTGAPGSGARSSSPRTASPLGPGGAPSGQVTLSGATTTTGTPPPPPVSPPPVVAAVAPSTGSTGTPPPPPPAGTSPVPADATLVGNTVTAAVTSVTDAAAQLGTAVPGTASTTGTLGSAVSGVG